MTLITFERGYLILPEPFRVELKAIVRGHTIVCTMTLEEMQREFACGTVENFEQEFRRLRPQIETWARKQIEAGASSRY